MLHTEVFDKVRSVIDSYFFVHIGGKTHLLGILGFLKGLGKGINVTPASGLLESDDSNAGAFCHL